MFLGFKVSKPSLLMGNKEKYFRTLPKYEVLHLTASFSLQWASI